MFRRRPLRRPALLRRSRPGSAVAPRVREALRRAYHALERGDAEEAARIFRRLAEAAAQRRMPLRAAGLTLEVAHAEALMGGAQAAVQNAERALRAFAQAGRPRRIAPAVERVVAALRQGGHDAEADRLEELLAQTLQQAGTSRRELGRDLEQARAQRRGQLPAKCPSCAGPLFPDEVEWSDATTACCAYCGSAVKAA